MGAIGLDQVGHENSDDESGFQALAEGDYEGAQHTLNVEPEDELHNFIVA